MAKVRVVGWSGARPHQPQVCAGAAAGAADGVTIAAAGLVRELDSAKKWPTYPVRANAVVPVERTAFAGPRATAP